LPQLTQGRFGLHIEEKRMNQRLIAGAGALVALLVLSGCATQQARFGAAPQRQMQEPFTVAQVLEQPQKYAGQYVRVAGVVTDLCEHAGCWMEVADKPGAKPLFVAFTYDLTTGRVPVEAKGHHAVLEGKIVLKEVPEERRRHIAAEQGAKPEQLALIKGPETQVQLECPSAEIEGVKPAAPQPCDQQKA
jgi:hypothetical protein